MNNEYTTTNETWIVGNKPIKVTIHKNQISNEAIDNFAQEYLRIKSILNR